MDLLLDKIGLVAGVANKYSIAWKIAQTWYENGANLIFTCRNNDRREEVENLVHSLDESFPVIPCDVEDDDDIEDLFEFIEEEYGRLDIMLHSIAFAPKTALQDSFVNLTRDDFLKTFDVSVYSLIAFARGASRLMSEGGSIQTITYIGSEKVIPNYNVMGPAKAALESAVRYLAVDLGGKNIRVNAISSGAFNTVSARGIPGFRTMLDEDAEAAPLARNIDSEDLGNASVYLASDLSSAVTGEILHVDCGIHLL